MSQQRMVTPSPPGFSYQQYLDAGWSDAQLVAYGLMRPETSMAAISADDQLRLFIERIERLKEESKGIADDIKDAFGEAKSQGYDPKVMREIIKLRAMEPHDRQELEAMIDTYKAALGLG